MGGTRVLVPDKVLVGGTWRLVPDKVLLEGKKVPAPDKVLLEGGTRLLLVPDNLVEEDTNNMTLWISESWGLAGFFRGSISPYHLKVDVFPVMLPKKQSVPRRIFSKILHKLHLRSILFQSCQTTAKKVSILLGIQNHEFFCKKKFRKLSNYRQNWKALNFIY